MNGTSLRQIPVHILTLSLPQPVKFSGWKVHTYAPQTENLMVLWRIYPQYKLQALVYDILPSTTAVFNYVIGSWKLSANEQFFVGAQTVVSLSQTTHIKQCVSFTAANKVDTSTYKYNRLNRDWTLSFTRGGCVSCSRACLGARLLLHVEDTRNFRYQSNFRYQKSTEKVPIWYN